MREWSEFEMYRERSRDLLREAEEARLAREARNGKVEKRRRLPLREDERASIRVRWGCVEDEAGIADLLDLNGMPRWVAFEERFIVAVENGVVRAALRYRTESKRLMLGLLVVDPWAGERRLARALYTGARDLGREMCVREVLAASGTRADYPGDAGYRRRGKVWRWDATQPAGAGVSDVRGAHLSLTTLAGTFLRRVGWR
ncbi:MAG TPA: hypothetical protein VFJ72_00610 [Rubrobacteraceae bacterium]|nr:hypothetical protein [Rubrobacteraceae bacterium]